MEKKDIKKVVLAYSGGLDTSIIIPWLKENYNNCEVIAVSGNVGQADELEGLEEKAIATGASKLYVLDLCDECGHGLAQINHHIGHFHLGFHQVKEFHEGLIVSFAEVAPFVVVPDEDIDSFEDRAVLHDRMSGLLDADHVLEPLLEEIGLQTERPALDIRIIVLQVRIEAHGFKPRLPSVVLR